MFSQHPFDIDLETCLSVPDNQTTIGMITCFQTAEQAWDAELNANYKLLMDMMTPPEAELLRSAQKAWLAFRDKENMYASTALNNLGGTMYMVQAAERSYALVKQRALELGIYQETIADVLFQTPDVDD